MKLGFIGCGNMASAMIKGIVSNGVIEATEIIASDAFQAAREKAGELGIHTTSDNIEVVRKAEVVVLAVKPQYIEAVISEIKEAVPEDKLLISIVAGKTIAWFEEKFEKQITLVRTMPNTPALVGEGMTGACANAKVTKEQLDQAVCILKGFGHVEVVPERLIDVVVSVSGSSPAYVFMFIEEMADAAVADGMPRDQAYRFAAQAVLGSAKMVMETGMHPAALKDMVCSPAGTTIEAVRVLEEKGMRSAVFEAMKACVKKAKEL